MLPYIKPLHTIGKASVNASIHKAITYFTRIKRYVIKPTCENYSSFTKNAFSTFVFILMAGVYVSRDENSLLDLISLIIRK